MTNEWTIQRRQAACGACESPYSDGERHVSALSVREKALAREDICEECWSERSPSDSLYYWFTRFALDKKKLRLDLTALESLFVRLEGRTEERVAEVRYVLCLILMRKRRLKLERVARDGNAPARERMIVKRPRRDEAFEVLVFDFTPERASELRAEVVGLLEGAGSELTPAPTAAAALDAGVESSTSQ